MKHSYKHRLEQYFMEFGFYFLLAMLFAYTM